MTRTVGRRVRHDEGPQPSARDELLRILALPWPELEKAERDGSLEKARAASWRESRMARRVEE